MSKKISWNNLSVLLSKILVNDWLKKIKALKVSSGRWYIEIKSQSTMILSDTTKIKVNLIFFKIRRILFLVMKFPNILKIIPYDS